MNRPSTAREALIVEAIGEVAALIDRVEAVAASMEATRQALVDASTAFAGQIVAFENHHMSAITESAKVHAVKHIVRRTDEIARSSLDAQTRAMEEAARALFRTEVGPALQALFRALQHLSERVERPWEGWLTHAATAAVASAATLVLAAHLWAR